MVIPSTLEVLEERTFYYCKKLVNVIFTEDSRLREIGSHCFTFSALKIFEAPPSLRKINNRVFCFCISLQRVTLNEGLETVGIGNKEPRDENGAFGCSGIKEVVIPGTLTTLARDSFENCRCLERVWVEQHCRIRIADYVAPKVDVRVFRVGGKSPLVNSQSRARRKERVFGEIKSRLIQS